MKVLTVVRRNPLFFPMACVAALVMVFISEVSYRQSIGSLDELGAMSIARASIASLQQGILAAEAGQRGYLLTARQEYLQSYEQALKEIGASFELLDRHYGAEQARSEVLTALHGLAAARLADLAAAIRLHDEGKAAASTDIVLSGINKKQMEAIRALGTELLRLESRRVEAGRSDIYRTLMLSRISFAALSAFGLLALYFYLRHASAVEEHQLQLQRSVRAERDRLEIEVTQRTAQLTELTRHLLTAREDERSRLARNLHDELGALLTSAKLDAARIRSRLADTAPEALERLSHLVATLNSSIALGRRIVEDLRPSTLGNLGLVPTLEILAREHAESSGVELHCALAPVPLSAAAELMVYRLVQEALTNIAKYAQASHIWVSLAAHEGRVEVSVRDDGVGFDAAARATSGFGLAGMRFRVEAEGGSLVVVSAPGQGTLVHVKLPQTARVAA